MSPWPWPVARLWPAVAEARSADFTDPGAETAAQINSRSWVRFGIAVTSTEKTVCGCHRKHNCGDPGTLLTVFLFHFHTVKDRQAYSGRHGAAPG